MCLMIAKILLKEKIVFILWVLSYLETVMSKSKIDYLIAETGKNSGFAVQLISIIASN
jgi:hypothetical protein